MCIVKTWCENTYEGECYLRHNGYVNAKRIFKTKFFICRRLGVKLRDVKVISLFKNKQLGVFD